LTQPKRKASRKSQYHGEVSLSAVGTHESVTEDYSPNADTQADLNPKFGDNMRIVPCQEMIVVDVEHNLKCKACNACPQNIIF
jgi:hypothetical protein